MQYNPYRDELNQMSAELARATPRADQIRQESQRYHVFDVDHVRGQAELVSAALPERASKVRELSERLNAANATVAALTNKSSIGFNPLFWLSDERRRLLQQLAEAKKSRASLLQSSKDAQAALDKAREKATKISEALGWYTSFNRDSAGEHLEQLTQRIDEIKSLLPNLQQKCAGLDMKLAPILSDLTAAQRRRDESNQVISTAEEFDRDLSGAANSYEKRMIHEQCRDKLGHDKPAQLISRARRDVEAAERDIEKLKRSASQVVARESRRIDRIVFDGNNLCYGRSREFIGIAPLKAIARELKIDAIKIMVFDASIRHHGYNERKLADAIGYGITVHIVNGTADETILNLTSGENDYVVSNDKFVDYRDKPAVVGGRVFRHERIDQKIMIHDLGISTSYT